MVLHSSAHMNQAEMVWPRADGMAEIAHNVNRRYRYIKEAGIPYRIRTTVFQFILLITRVSALSSAQQQLMWPAAYGCAMLVQGRDCEGQERTVEVTEQGSRDTNGIDNLSLMPMMVASPLCQRVESSCARGHSLL